VKIGFKFQSLGKISNISTSDPPPPVLLGQFQHWEKALTAQMHWRVCDQHVKLLYRIVSYRNSRVAQQLWRLRQWLSVSTLYQ